MDWQDDSEMTPVAVWVVKTQDGKEYEATYHTGDWETLEGERIRGVTHWKPGYNVAVRALYTIRDIWDA